MAAVAMTTRRKELLSAIRARISRVGSGTDGVLAPDGEAEASALADIAYHDREDVEAAYVLGSWHWWRHSLLEAGAELSEYRAAVAWFSRVFPLRSDLVPEELHSMVAQIAEPSGTTVAARNAEAVRLMADPVASANPAVLDRVIRLLERVATDVGTNAPDSAMRLSNLGIALLRRYDQQSKQADLERAMFVLRQSLSMTAADDPYRAHRLTHLGWAQRAHFDVTQEPRDLDAAVQTLVSAVAAAPSDNPDRPMVLMALAEAFGARFRSSEALADLYRAVTTGEDAVAVLPPDSPERPAVLTRLVELLLVRYERAGVAMDLDRAIELGAEAARATSDGDPELARRRGALGQALLARYRLTGLVDDLSRSILELDRSLADAAADPRDQVGTLVALGTALGERYDRTRAIGDLDRATSVREEALACVPVGDPVRPDRLVDLAAVLTLRFGRLGVLADLDGAIRLCGEAIATASVISPDRPRFLSQLAVTLSARFEHTGSVDDLDRAIEVAEEALAGTAQPTPNALSTMQRLLAARFELKEAAADLERCIAAGEQAVALTDASDPQRARRLWALSDALAIRYARLGDRTDLDRAIAMGESATAEGPTDIDGAFRLAANLRTRFAGGGPPADLDRAIALTRTVAAIDHPERGNRLAITADMLAQRYELGGDLSDLDAAVRAADASVAVTIAPHPDRRQRLCELANLIRRRVGAHPLEVDHALLERGIQAAEEGASRSAGADATVGPSWARCERALLLWLRAEHTGQPDDVNLAVTALTETLTRLATRDPYRGRCLYALGSGLRTRFEATSGVLTDAEAALEALREATATDVAPAGLRLRAATQWATFAADRGDWDQATAAWEAALTLEIPGEPDSDRLERLGPAGRVELLADSASAAAAAALGTGDAKRAWRLFDRGRDLVLRLSRDEQESTVDNSPSDGTEVVVNLTRWRCDALIRGADGVSYVALPYLTPAEVSNRADALRAALAQPNLTSSRTILEVTTWLWDTVAGPVLDHLGYRSTPKDTWPRVHWRPIGVMAGLPLHAAGRPTEPGMSTVDRVMSSFPPDLPHAKPGPAASVSALWPLAGGLGAAISQSIAAGAEPVVAVHQATRRERARYPRHAYLWAPYIHVHER